MKDFPAEDNQVNSDEIQDIIATPPAWLFRWGITIVFSLLACVTVLAAFIRYPDTVSMKIKILATDPPIPVTIDTGAIITKVMVKNNEQVTTAQPLVCLKELSGKEIIISAPQSGRISFATDLLPGRQLTKKQTLFFITNNHPGFYGELSIPASSIAKVKRGQEVLIKLKDYPHTEPGVLHGVLDFIPEIPVEDSFFIATVNIPDSNHTTLRNAMWAEADIVTANSSLLSRLYKNAWKQHSK